MLVITILMVLIKINFKLISQFWELLNTHLYKSVFFVADKSTQLKTI